MSTHQEPSDGADPFGELTSDRLTAIATKVTDTRKAMDVPPDVGVPSLLLIAAGHFKANGASPVDFALLAEEAFDRVYHLHHGGQA